LEVEHENLRASLDWSLMEAEPRSGLRLCGALQRFWCVRGHLTEGREWCSRVLDKAESDERTPERGKALTAAGVLAQYQGDIASARALYEESLAIMRISGDQGSIARVLNNLGNVALDQGDLVSARARHEESLAIKRGLGDPRIATSLHNLGMVAHEQGDYPAARALYEESLGIKRERGDRAGIAASLHNLGNVTFEQGDYSAARALHQEAMVIRRELGDRWGMAHDLGSLGNAAFEQGEFASAWALRKEGLAIQRDLGDRRGIADSLDGHAPVVAGLGSILRAACLWGATERLRTEIGYPLPPYDRPRYDRRVAAARAMLGDDAAFDRAWQEGRALAMEQAIELALKETTEPG
jgi:tetratricopeptide (TPR) repeat protein